MLIVVPKEGYVIHFILLALGRLPINGQELLISVIVHVLDVVNIKAVLP